MKPQTTVTIVLFGDIESCCSFTPASAVEAMVREWLPAGTVLHVIDLEEDPNPAWTKDELVRCAEQHFKEKAYPLVYIDNTLCMFGALPSRKSMLKYLSGEERYGITAVDIETAARYVLPHD